MVTIIPNSYILVRLPELGEVSVTIKEVLKV